MLMYVTVHTHVRTPVFNTSIRHCWPQSNNKNVHAKVSSVYKYNVPLHVNAIAHVVVHVRGYYTCGTHMFSGGVITLMDILCTIACKACSVFTRTLCLTCSLYNTHTHDINSHYTLTHSLTHLMCTDTK